jgi:hypothetical protein
MDGGLSRWSQWLVRERRFQKLAHAPVLGLDLANEILGPFRASELSGLL